MHRPRVAAVVVFSAALASIAASQAADRFRVATPQRVDVHQETLEEISSGPTQATEVFPGRFDSPFGAAVMKRIDALIARVDELDRGALVAAKVGLGFDRAMIKWRADPPARTVAMAVHYYRARLLQLDMEFSDDYGRPEPLDPADYEFFTVAVCSRAGGGWSCREEQIAVLAKKHNLPLSNDRAPQDAVVDKLLELALAGQ